MLMLYILCIIGSIVYILLLPQSGDVIHNVGDVFNITDFSDIVDTTDILDYINYIGYINFDTEYKSIERSILKEQFNEFIKLFSKDKDVYFNSKVNNYVKDDIIKPLLMQHLDSLTKDISDLKDQVSLLKIDLQNKEIQNIDARKYYEQSINSVLRD